jgi:UDP-N-acetylglucosamine 1-carboxyvinyltransferase
MKSRFVVEGLAGKKTLRGTIAVRGAKNAALKALAASVLFEDAVAFENLPDIEDVKRMQELLDGDLPVLRKDIAERLRASIVLTGPVLARYGSVTFPFPGGCVLGERPIDLFLEGYRALGAKVEENGDLFVISGKLRGAHIFFPSVSVTATETLMLAAVLAEGETVLENAAMEPEIGTLIRYLNACGAHIEGADTPRLVIKGTNGKLLKAEAKPCVIPPDRIETGSFIILAALAGEEVTITDCEPKHADALIALMRRAGVTLEIAERSIVVRGGGPYKSVSVRTHEYPGFPTDLQAPMAVFLTQCKGEATILETIFDGRFRYADDLIRMGADITVMNPHKILIRGPKALTDKQMESPDLRGGLAYLIAAAVAEGVSTIDNAYLIDRGYEHIEERLKSLGLNITRTEV